VKRKQLLTVLVAVLVTALFVIPGVAFGKKGGGGGNGTPSPPPSNPPCDADGHLLQPDFLAKHKQCNDGGSTGHGGTNGTNGKPTDPPCDSDNHLVNLPPGLSKNGKCPSSTSTSTSSSSSSSTSTATSTATTTSTSGDVCETDGLLGAKGLDLGEDRTIGQIVWDELGLVVQDPQIPPGGSLSGPLYNGILSIPLAGLETPAAAEVGCLLNNLSL
jgi:hypothetical protein